MKCFVHQSVDAVGLCRNCSRGVCAECAADRPSGIACRGRCEESVDAVDALVRRNVAVAGKPSATHWVQAFVYIGAAVGMGVIAYGDAVNGGRNTVAILLSILAVLMLTCGIMVLRWIFVNVRPAGAQS